MLGSVRMRRDYDAGLLGGSGDLDHMLRGVYVVGRGNFVAVHVRRALHGHLLVRVGRGGPCRFGLGRASVGDGSGTFDLDVVLFVVLSPRVVRLEVGRRVARYGDVGRPFADSGQLGLAFLEYLPSGRNYTYYRDGSVGSQLRPEELTEAVFADASILHLPGMLLELNDSMRQSCFRAVELAKQNHVLFSFDPNLRKELRNDAQMRQRMMQMLSMADVIEPTLEEARIITGCTAISDVLRALHAAGPRLVVLTRDKDGALFSFDGQVLSAEGIDVPVVDPTGAGDTFAAALACCIEENVRMEDAISFCNCAGTLVCTKRGAIGMAIPTREQVLDMMRLHPARLHMESLQALYEKEHKHEIA